MGSAAGDGMLSDASVRLRDSLLLDVGIMRRFPYAIGEVHIGRSKDEARLEFDQFACELLDSLNELESQVLSDDDLVIGDFELEVR